MYVYFDRFILACSFFSDKRPKAYNIYINLVVEIHSYKFRTSKPGKNIHPTRLKV